MSEELYSEPQVQSQSAPSKSVFAALCPLVASVALLCLSAGITVAMLAKSQRGFFALAGVSGLLALVAGLLSVVAIIVVMSKKQKGLAYAIIGLVMSIGVFTASGISVMVGSLVLTHGVTQSKIDQYVSNERMYFAAKMQVLANYLKEHHSDKTFLVVNNQYNEATMANKEAVDRAFAGLSYLSYEIPVPVAAGPDDDMYDLDVMLSAETFDQIMADYHDRADVLVSLVGLPMDFQMMKMWDIKGWRQKYGQEPMKLVLVDGYIYELEKPIQVGMILAAVQFNPTAEYKVDEIVSDDYQQAFDKRYILVTPENIQEMSVKYDGLFAQE